MARQSHQGNANLKAGSLGESLAVLALPSLPLEWKVALPPPILPPPNGLAWWGLGTWGPVEGCPQIAAFFPGLASCPAPIPARREGLVAMGTL